MSMRMSSTRSSRSKFMAPYVTFLFKSCKSLWVSAGLVVRFNLEFPDYAEEVPEPVLDE